MIGFSSGGAFGIGIEEELLLVDPRELALLPDAAGVLERMHAPEGAASHEVYAAQIELRSRPSDTTAAAIEALADLRSSAVDAGALLLGAGLHPTGAFGDAPLVETERYRHVAESMRGLMRRTPECALHIHVGMPDVETAVRALNGLRTYLPLLQALAANSPMWFGTDSGLASARAALVRSYPGRGIPRAMRDAADWRVAAKASLAAAGVEDPTLLWWDVRLHPRYGTLEVRELDAQSSLVSAAALAALVRALAVEAAGFPPTIDVPSEALSWSAFRATRDGVSGSILHGDALRPVEELARETVERLRPVARELGDEKSLESVIALVSDGGGASRQRRTFAREGMFGLLRSLVEETGTRAPPASGMAPASRECRVVQEWLDARAQCDLGRVAALTAEDAVWESPVHGEQHGRRSVLDQIKAAFTDSDEFATELLALECRPAKAVALIRNTGRRNGEVLDSTQRLFFRLRGELVTSVTVAVDDPEAVQAFWAQSE